MKRILLSSLVLGMTVALACGCAGLGKGPSDEELIAGVLESWKASMTAQDVDTLMTTYSEDFEHYEVGDKEGVREFLEGAVDMGYLEGVEILIDEAETTIDGEAATIYPIDLTSDAGEVTIELTLAKEEAGWLVTGMDIEGL